MNPSIQFMWISIIYLCQATTDAEETFKIAVLYDGSSLNYDHLKETTINTTHLENKGLVINFTYQDVELDNIFDSSRKVCRFVEKEYSGFISFLNCQSTQYVDYYTNALYIPNVIYMNYPCDLPKRNSNTVKLTPHCYTKNLVLTNIVEYEKWSNIVIIYDESLNSRCLQDLLVQVSKLLTRSRLVSLKTSTNITGALEDVKSLKEKNFIVMVDQVSVNTILEKAQVQGMLTGNYFWVIVEMKLRSPWITTQYKAGENIICVKQAIGIADSENCNVNLNLNPTPNELLYLQDAQSIYLAAFNRYVQKHPPLIFQPTNCSNLKITPSTSYKTIASALMNAKLIGRTGKLESDDDGYPVFNRYEICSQNNVTDSSIETVATWDTLQGLQVRSNRLFPNTFTGFGNRTLVIATQEARPFTIRSVVNGTVVFTGFCINILDELANRFNFRYQLIEPPDGLWGGPNNDGTWNGMVGMVRRREVEFAVGPFTITSLREQVIDFTKPYMEDGAGIITKRPDGESDKMFQIFKPFATPVWACIAVSIIVVGVLLYIVNRFSPYTAYNRRLQDSSSDEVSFASNMWLIYGALVEQGGVSFPTAASGRFILGFWWLFTILITSTYTANLAAYLTVTIAEKPINSLIELNAQNEIKPLVKVGTNLHSLFQRAESGIYQKIWSQMSEMPIVKSADEALVLVRQGKTAFMTDRTQLEYIVLKDCVTYALADEIFNTAGYGFVLPENAPYMDRFNYNIMRMQEAGLIENWRQKWWPRSDSCSNSARTSSARALGLDSLAGPFLVYVSVAGLSFICLMIEICIQRCNHEDKRKVDPPSKHSNGVTSNGEANSSFY